MATHKHEVAGEDGSDSAGIDSGAHTPSQVLRERLSAFRFDHELTPSLRRSPRTRSSFKKEEFEERESELPQPSTSSRVVRSSSRARKKQPVSKDLEGVSVKEEENLGTSVPASRKRARSSSSPVKPKGKARIAPLDKYAHLKALSDDLGEHPDTLDGEI